jgi:cysteinyl-tRNA synthetase
MHDINYISRALRASQAYVVNVPKVGPFVIMSASAKKLRAPAIKYDQVEGFLRDPNDFVVWIPDAALTDTPEFAFDAPWGTGRPSANLYVFCIYK